MKNPLVKKFPQIYGRGAQRRKALSESQQGKLEQYEFDLEDLQGEYDGAFELYMDTLDEIIKDAQEQKSVARELKPIGSQLLKGNFSTYNSADIDNLATTTAWIKDKVDETLPIAKDLAKIANKMADLAERVADLRTQAEE